MTPIAELSPLDAVRLRNQKFAAGRGIATPLADVPDGELIRTLVAHGQPEWSARQLTVNAQLRLAALRFWVDVGDAGRGNVEAKERVDYMRACFQALRREELISDDPARGHGDVIDPRELL